MTQPGDIPENLKLEPCPFCGATPHRGPTKVMIDQLHGEPFQRWRIWCPKGHAQVEEVNEKQASERWNSRTSHSRTSERIVVLRDRLLIYVVEEDEGAVRLSIAGHEIGRWSASSAKGIALLKLDAELRALASPPTEAGEMVLVPRELTGAMIEAALALRPVGLFWPGSTAAESEEANEKYFGLDRVRQIWSALLAAAPQDRPE